MGLWPFDSVAQGKIIFLIPWFLTDLFLGFACVCDRDGVRWCEPHKWDKWNTVHYRNSTVHFTERKLTTGHFSFYFTCTVWSLMLCLDNWTKQCEHIKRELWLYSAEDLLVPCELELNNISTLYSACLKRKFELLYHFVWSKELPMQARIYRIPGGSRQRQASQQACRSTHGLIVLKYNSDLTD